MRDRAMAPNAGGADMRAAGLTQEETARVLGTTRGAVDQAERRALRKMRRHPVMVAMAREMGLLGNADS